MQLIETIEGLESYAKEIKPTVLLDTNVLISVHGGKSEERQIVSKICSVLDISISDTVYWEFLRNTNIENFRERRKFLSELNSGKLLHEDAIHREDDNIKEMHARLFLLLLSEYRSDPRRAYSLLTPDLWIAASAIQHSVDHILTANHADFPSVLFVKVAKINCAGTAFSLLKFDRLKARQIWISLNKNPVFEINAQSYFQKKKKS